MNLKKAIEICMTHFACTGRMGFCHFVCEECKFNHDHEEYIRARKYIQKLIDKEESSKGGKEN